MGPGLYAIVSIKNQKIYIGESSNVAERLGKHWNDLSKEKHECQQLQLDWNQFGSENFNFISLSVGSQWINLQLRREVET